MGGGGAPGRSTLRPILIAGALLCAASLALIWPGIVVYDALDQYTQAATGDYHDWHPPLMARVWGVLLTLGLTGSAPMLVLQQLPFWAGLTLVAAGLARDAPRRAGWVLGIGLLPIVLDWMTVVVKDAELAAALTAATGVVAWHRLRDRPMRAPAVAGTALLLAYAMLVRANAVFAAMPLACAWSHWAGLRRPAVRAGLLGLGTLAVIATLPLVAHRVFQAEPTHVERTLPVFDMAGIAHHAGLATVPGLPPALWARAEAQGCYKPLYWDPYGEPRQCGYVSDAIAFGDGAGGHIHRDWVGLILRHPLAYAAHRLAHWNATLRFLVPLGEKGAQAPRQSEINDDGIGRRAGPVTWALWGLAVGQSLTPLGWPAFWLAGALGLWWTAAGTARSPRRDLALSLALSAACLSSSFLVVSIASDLRYHLWTLIAVSLAALLLAGLPGLPRARLRATYAALGLVAVTGGLARLLMVPAW